MQTGIVVGSAILIFMGILIVLGRHESCLMPRDPPFYRIPVRRAAVCLCRKIHEAGKKGRFHGHEWMRESVRRDLMTLYPTKHVRMREAIFLADQLERIMWLVSAGAALAILAGWLMNQSGPLIHNRYVEREDYSGSPLTVTADESTYGEFTFEVEPRKYTKTELEQMAEDLFAQLPERIRAENPDLQHVSRNLKLKGVAEDTPFQVRWTSSRYELVDTDGTVHAEGLPEGAQIPVQLSAVCRADDSRFETVLDLTVVPEQLSPMEQMQNAIREALSDADRKTASEPRFWMPQEVNGEALSWDSPGQDYGVPILFVTAAAGIALSAGAGAQLHRQIQERERQMTLDYPKVLSRLVLLVGAGLSVRTSFSRLGEDYEKMREKGGEQHFVYEEILLMCHEMDNGILEMEAYTRFGQRCRSRRYTRLSSLLTQNLKKGNSELLRVLMEEADASFEERKSIAKQLGEEAGTKLLLPMMLMLVITLVMIMVPAYLGFAM